MALYNKEDYFQIYDALIEVGKKYPFDSYLLLPKNKRIVLLVKKDVEFTKEQIRKFNKLKKSGIFIKQEDIKIYSDFFKKNIKKAEYEWLRKDIINVLGSKQVEGIPEEIIAVLNNTADKQTNSENTATNIITCSNQDLEDKKQKILAAIEKILAEMAIVKNINSYMDKEQIIRNITEIIKPEIQIITGIVNSLPYDQHPELIAGSALVQDKFISLISWVNDLKDYMINVIPGKSINDPEFCIIPNRMVKEGFLSEILDIKRIINSNVPEAKDIEVHHLEAQSIVAEEIISGSIEAKHIIADKITINGVETIYSEQNSENIKPRSINQEEIIDQEKINDKRHNELLEIFKDLLIKFESYDTNQNLVKGNIAGLKEKLSSMITDDFVKKNNSSEKYNLSLLAKRLNEFEYDAFGPNSVYNELISITNKISDYFNIEHLKITSKKIIPGVYRLSSSFENFEETSLEPIKNDISLDELKESYSLLEAQVKNLNNIITSNNAQMAENEKILDKSQEYIMQLENENFFYMKRNEEFQNNSKDTEIKVEKLKETAEDNYKLMAKLKIDVSNKEKQIKLLESALDAFKNSSSTTTTLDEKNEESLEDLYKKNRRSSEESYRDIITKQNNELTGYVNKISNLEKKLIEYTHKLSRAENFNRGLGAKIESIDREKSELERIQKNLDLRNKIVSNMLEQTKKSFEKLNAINARLKDEKGLFYKKMSTMIEENKILKKEMQKTSIKTDSEKQQIEKLEKFIESQKEKDRASISKFSELKDSYKLIDEENKILKRDSTNIKTKLENIIKDNEALRINISKKDEQIRHLEQKIAEEFKKAS